MTTEPAHTVYPWRTARFYIIWFLLNCLSLILLVLGILCFVWDFWAVYIGVKPAELVFPLFMMTIATTNLFLSAILSSMFSQDIRRSRKPPWLVVSTIAFIALTVLLYLAVNRPFKFYIMAVDQNGQRVACPFKSCIASSQRHWTPRHILYSFDPSMKYSENIVYYDRNSIGLVDPPVAFGESISLFTYDSSDYLYPGKYARFTHRDIKLKNCFKEHPIVIHVLNAPRTNVIDYGDISTKVDGVEDAVADLYAGKVGPVGDNPADLTFHLIKPPGANTGWTLCISSEHGGIKLSPKGDKGAWAPATGYSKALNIKLHRHSRPTWTYFLIEDGPVKFYYHDDKIYCHLSLECFLDYKRESYPVEVGYNMRGTANPEGGRSLRTNNHYRYKLPIERGNQDLGG